MNVHFLKEVTARQFVSRSTDLQQTKQFRLQLKFRVFGILFGCTLSTICHCASVLCPTILFVWFVSITLDSGIDVAPGINVAPPLKNFHITIFILFYINLGIAVIFDFIFSSKFFKNQLAYPYVYSRVQSTQVFSYYLWVTLDEVVMNKVDLPRKERENM